MTLLRQLIALLLLAGSALAAAANAPNASSPAHPIVRAQLSAAQVRVGETMTLELAVLVPGWLTAPIDLPASLDLPGATVRLSEHSAPNLNETVNGIAYAGVRRRYEIVAQHAGRFELPPIAFTVAFADGTRRASVPLISPALRVEATLPAGLEGLGYIIVSPDFRLSQSFDRKLDKLQTGDALVRTLSQRAESMSAVNLPTLRFMPLPGLATYPDVPQFDEQGGERNSPRIATQHQRVTYVLEQAGDYELPGVELRWLNSRNGQVRTARLPSVRLRVNGASPGIMPSASPATMPSQTQSRPPSWRERTLRSAPWLAGLLFSGLALWSLRKRR